jgi:hypothetical protein
MQQLTFAMASILSVILNPDVVPVVDRQSAPAPQLLLSYIPPSATDATSHCEECRCEQKVEVPDEDVHSFLSDFFDVFSKGAFVQLVMFAIASVSTWIKRKEEPDKADPNCEENIALRAELEAKDAEIVRLENQVKETNDQNGTLKCERHRLNTTVEENEMLEVRVKTLEAMIRDLKANKKKQRKQSKQTSSSLPGEKFELLIQNTSQQVELKDQADEINELKQQLQKSQASVNRLRWSNLKVGHQGSELRSFMFYVLCNNCLKQKNTNLKQKLETETVNHEYLCKIWKANLDGMVQQRVSLLEEQLECYIHTMLKSLNEHVTKLEASHEKATHAMLVNASKVARYESTTACDTLRIKTELSDILNSFYNGFVRLVRRPR